MLRSCGKTANSLSIESRTTGGLLSPSCDQKAWLVINSWGYPGIHTLCSHNYSTILSTVNFGSLPLFEQKFYPVSTVPITKTTN